MQHKEENPQPCNCMLDSKRHKQVNEEAKQGEKSSIHMQIFSVKSFEWWSLTKITEIL